MAQPYVYRAPDKQVTEIRVHGVGGTPPEKLLDHPHPEQVAGDDIAGFFRRPDGSAARDVEAYSWGGLTSRNVLRSLWLLLLPFALANVAGWMIEVDTTRRRSKVQRHAEIEEWLIRIAGALLTVSVVVWTAAIAVDLVAFRCGSQEACREGHWWLEFLGNRFFGEQHPLAGVATAALVPLAVLGILAFLSRRNRRRYDEFPPFAPGEPEAGDAADLKSERFWYRPSLVADLAAFHGAAGSWTLAALLAATASSFFSDASHDVLRWVAFISGVLAGASVIACACLRPSRQPTEQPKRWPRRVYFYFGCLGIATVIGLAVWCLFVTQVDKTPATLVVLARMPFYVLALQIGVAVLLGVVHFTWWFSQLMRRDREGRDPRPSWLASSVACAIAFAYLVILLRWPPFPVFGIVAVAAFVVVIRTRPSWVVVATFISGVVVAIGLYAWKDTWVPAIVAGCLLAAALSVLAIDATWPRARFRWGGATVPSLIAVLLTAGVFTGLAIRLADFLDKERSSEEIATSGAGPAINLDLLPAYDWFAVAFAGAIAITAICAVVLYLHLRARIDHEAIELAPLPSPMPGGAVKLNKDRKTDLKKRVAGSMAIVRTIGGADVLLTFLAAVAALAMLRGMGDAMNANFSGTFLAKLFSATFWKQILTVDYPLPTRWEWLLTPAAWLLATLPLALMFGLRKAFSDQGARRKVGIIWDVATFWPRRFHPFAPPSYSERAVPELQERMRLATEGGRTVVLSAHSQGTIVAYAAVASSPVKGKGKIVLATYGSPLGTLYERYFPNYFRLDDYRSIATELERSNKPDDRGWRNFYRVTDPIGGPLFNAVTRPLDAPAPDDAEPDDRDVRLHDPWWAFHRKTQPLPPLLGHSDYMDDPDVANWISR